MLTRHLYELDEVAAALMWCIKNQRMEEVAFWTQEMIDSEMIDSLYTTLYYAWIWLFGVRKMSCLLELYDLFHREEDLTDDEIVAFALRLSRLSGTYKDASILSLLVFGCLDTIQPDNVVANKNVPLEEAFLHACWQGKARLAWDLTRGKDSKWVYESVRKVAAEKHKGSEEILKALDILEEDECKIPYATRCCAVAVVCMPSVKESFQHVDTKVHESILEKREQWKGLEGRRARRQYSIPNDCLYWITQRGLGSNKKQNQKRVICGSWDALRGCTFWDRVLEEYRPWESDDQKEHFYDTYFPDDIPDEWSKAEREKSHGYGCLIGEEIPSFEKYARRWFRGIPSCCVWMGSSDALQLLSKIPDIESGWDSLYEMADLIACMERWDLSPKTQRKFVEI